MEQVIVSLTVGSVVGLILTDAVGPVEVLIWMHSLSTDVDGLLYEVTTSM